MSAPNLPADVRASLRRHVTTALDTPPLYSHGTLYDDTLKGFVAPLVTADCPPIQPDPEIVELSNNAPWSERKALVEALRLRPRGAWLVRKTGDRYCPSTSAGNGELTGHSDTYDTMPTWQRVYDRMIGYEIYLMRHEIEAEREAAANLAALPAFTVGQTFRGLRINMATFSTAEVVAIAPEDKPDSVRLKLTKRGSALRWNATIPAAKLLARVEGLAP